jgi:hypothetical protein
VSVPAAYWVVETIDRSGTARIDRVSADEGEPELP